MKKTIIFFFLMAYSFSFAKTISLFKEAEKKEITKVIFQKDVKYLIYSMPLRQTIINFGDEKIEYAETGDNVQWSVMEDIHSVKIKPSDVNLKTDLLVKTNENTYYFIVSSYYAFYNPIINFLYPQKIENKIRRRKEQEIPLSIINIDELNNSYSISKNYNWTPTQIFDDGKKTYLIMNPNIQEMPVFLTRTEDNNYALVNFRVKKTNNGLNIMIIDRIFKTGILKLGKKQIVIKNKKYRY
ncbi:TrbG/VirB9 family P-type conjugative transfer protein [uncultured Cetobacterium sp.]|uniref:TrbG/VirB9 family P-type conjugative transfer protein n=1 Tax=uncultured Cetobacterium sp. TaxID=527638 RepID=UPI00262FECED|nr:TrbG/VirB9 family P-type conjugative transfer protein [uncultured Cetobacterium sp.]